MTDPEQALDVAPDTEVLVVGAGPTGLLLAGVLVRAGVAVRIVDAGQSRSTHSKALIVHAATLETLDLLGLAGSLVEMGHPVAGARVDLGDGAQFDIAMSSLESRYPFLLVLAQSRTEQVLEEDLATRGVEVERGSRLVTLSQGRTGVVAELDAGGPRGRIAARYLVGCDGTHSAVRRAAGIGFPGRDYGVTALLGDVRVDGAIGTATLHTFAAAQGCAILIPFGDGYHRLIVVDPAIQPDASRPAPSLEELQDGADRLVRPSVRLHDPRWLSRFGSPLRSAERYRRGRVFVAGDAAHAHSPAGGQGMNMGLHDAHNLGWKLARVLRGRSPEAVLDTDDAERRGADARTMALTDRIFTALTVRSPALRRVERLVARAVLPMDAVQVRAAANLAGLRTTYRAPRSLATVLAPRGPVPGDRVPDLALGRPGSGSTRLGELLARHGFVALTYLAPHQVASGAALDALTSAVPPDQMHHVFVTAARECPRPLPDPTYDDGEGAMARWLGGDHRSTTVGVRPDGHLAFRLGGLDSTALSDAAAIWVGR